MRPYDEERGDYVAPTTKQNAKLAWQSEVREELEDMDSDMRFYAIVKWSEHIATGAVDEFDHSYHTTLDGARARIVKLATDLAGEPPTYNIVFAHNTDTDYVEYYIEERIFSD